MRELGGNTMSTDLLQQIVDIEVHLKNRLLSALVVQRNDKGSGGW